MVVTYRYRDLLQTRVSTGADRFLRFTYISGYYCSVCCHSLATHLVKTQLHSLPTTSNVPRAHRHPALANSSVGRRLCCHLLYTAPLILHDQAEIMSPAGNIIRLDVGSESVLGVGLEIGRAHV